MIYLYCDLCILTLHVAPVDSYIKNMILVKHMCSVVLVLAFSKLSVNSMQERRNKLRSIRSVRAINQQKSRRKSIVNSFLLIKCEKEKSNQSKTIQYPGFDVPSQPFQNYRLKIYYWHLFILATSLNQKTLKQEDDFIAILKCIECCYKANSFTWQL